MPAAHYINPHAAAMTAHTAELNDALRAVAALSADLAWFNGIDRHSLHAAVASAAQSRRDLVDGAKRDLAAIDALPDRTPSNLARGVVGLAAALALAPLGAAFSAAAFGAAASATALSRDPDAAERQRLDASLTNRRRLIAELDERMAADRATLARHAAFDRDGVVVRLEEARAARDRAEELLASAVRHHDDAEARLKPLAQELAAAEAAEAALRRDLARAEKSRASVSYERVRVLTAQLAGAQRTTAKWRERLAFATHDAAHVIDHLVLDGSNLCYIQKGRQRRFLGLAALDALLPELAGRYRVTVVFDASTRRQLDLPRGALEEHFGDQVEVHVASAGHGADKTYLRYADAPTTWVVTNDQLRDFTDLPAVAEGRILKYELLQRMVEIPVLDVVAHFGD